MGCKAIDEERIEERIKPRKENCMNCRTRLNPGLLDYGLKMKFKWKYQVLFKCLSSDHRSSSADKVLQ